MPLTPFDPLVRDWFNSRFPAVTEPQRQGWPHIRALRDVLISAPTGAGKTLSAFLTAIDSLVTQARSGPLPNQTQVLYVSPLKALSNDIHKNLDVPLAGISALAKARGIPLAEIRTAVRTGDTPASERAKMSRKAPHILVTTPESLYILLTAAGPRKMLSSVRTLIVDEIHAIADDKRGSHLALSIARLEALTGAPLQKIGLSATVSPIEEVAKFLSPHAEIVQVGRRRNLDLAVEVPRDELGAVASTEMWSEIYDRIAALAREHRTTLVFVNTRKLSERVAHNLAERLSPSTDQPVSPPQPQPIHDNHGALSEPQSFRDSHGAVPQPQPIRDSHGAVPQPQPIHDNHGAVPQPQPIRDSHGAVPQPQSFRDSHGAVPQPQPIHDNHGAIPPPKPSRDSHGAAAPPNAPHPHDDNHRSGPARHQQPVVLPHHGSLSRRLRLEAEEKLKNGDLRVVVATASLELGIDIGTVDLVCQIGSPRSIAVGLQRVGRAGHWVGALPKGRFFATTRDDLVECAALIRAIRATELDRLEIPEAPLDILAQQLVAACACEDFSEDDLFALVRRAYPYRHLERHQFDEVLAMLSEGIATGRGRSAALLHRDQVNHRVRGRRAARLVAITNGGAIPDTAQYQVIAEPEGTQIGSVDEDFAVESLVGDVFLLGTTSWRIRRVEPGRVRVEDAHGAAPSIPFWRGEAPGRTRELSDEVSRLREEVAAAKDPVALLEVECALDRSGAEQATTYIRAGRNALGVVPTQATVVAERFFDEAGGMQFVLHAPFGSRINRAWGLALRKRFCRAFNFELQAAATDNGLVLSLSDQHSFPLDLVFSFLTSGTVEHVLTQALLDSPMFGARWKWNASRALAVPRFQGGRKVPPPIQRMRADDLLAAVFPDQAACAENLTGEIRIPDHPLVNETISNCLHEAMDLDGLKTILERIADGSIRTVSIDTREPSPFCHEILNANPYAFLDDAPLEERRTRAVQMRRSLSSEDAANLGALDPAAIAQASEEAWPVVRNADELHDALLTLIILPAVEEWREYFNQLVATGRASQLPQAVAQASACGLWTATERLSQVNDPVAILRGWMDSIGPVTPAELSQRLSLPQDAVDSALAQLESEGQILRGNFSAEGQFCHRRILARIHRMTLGRLRREIEPVSTSQFMTFLCRWQHVAPGSQQHGVDGLFQVLRQLQGCELSASAWESTVLPSRISNYDPEWLDRLCLSGEIQWGRLSPHPALESEGSRRVRPTRVAPVALFLREDAPSLLPPVNQLPLLSHAARDVLTALEARGALFFEEILRASGRLASEVEDGLWELVAAGLVTADGFENLRALIDPKRRRGEGRARFSRPRHAAGRWTLLGRTGDRFLSPVSPNPEFFAKQLLDRWGVVFRDILQRETLAPPWRDLLQIYRRMEARGELRGGRFVSGFLGEQFGRPEAVDLLRHLRRSAATGEEIEIAPTDPLNLTGVLLPGPRTATFAQVPLRLIDGVPMGVPTPASFVPQAS
jgi:ATP-dependent Lhr-like helicase